MAEPKSKSNGEVTEKRQPNYTPVVMDELPAEVVRGARNTYKALTDGVVNDPKLHNAWVRIALYGSNKSAKSLADRLNENPIDGMTVERRHTADGHGVFVRYVPPVAAKG